MKRLRRSLIILALSLAGTLIAIAVRTLDAFGAFTTVKPGFAGTCAPLPTPAAVRDIAIDRATRMLFFSAGDGVYDLSADHPERGDAKLAGTPRDFHPRGISLFRGNDGSLTLMAINRPKAEEPRIEIFDVRSQDGRRTLVQTTSVSSGLLVAPFGIAAASKAQFYVTNAWTSRTSLGRTLEIYAMLPRANVVYFGGDSFRVVAQDLNMATGIALSQDGAHVYVASATGRALYIFGREPFTGALTQQGKLALPSAPLGVSVASNGEIWIAAEPNLRLGDAPPREPIPSEILQVAQSGSIPSASMPILVDSGTKISAANAVDTDDGRIFLGSHYDSKILECERSTLSDTNY